MNFTNPYWSNKLKMSALQRWIIVHSILYYELDSSIITDAMFDSNAKQLVQMHEEFPDEAECTDYWYVFYDFDGTTGFDLYHRLNKKDREYLEHIAKHVLKLSQRGGKKSEGRRTSKNDSR